ncbi:hypothetical protein HMPREF1529_02303 [Microbacterium sp. oral taxon 186 str. F0373]|nr:hypothetical protein HMPREF1529_02303 [Microbacterium sp. oral taxon 186 str. F0373]
MRTRTDHRPRARRSAHLQALHRRAARRGMQRLRQDPPRLPAPRRETALQQLPTAAPGREEVLQPLRQRTPGAHDHCGRPALPRMRPRESRTLRALRAHRPRQGAVHWRRDLQPLLQRHPQHAPTLPPMPARHFGRIRRRRRHPRLHTLRGTVISVHLRQLRHRRHPSRQEVLSLQRPRRRRRPLRRRHPRPAGGARAAPGQAPEPPRAEIHGPMAATLRLRPIDPRHAYRAPRDLSRRPRRAPCHPSRRTHASRPHRRRRAPTPRPGLVALRTLARPVPHRPPRRDLPHPRPLLPMVRHRPHPAADRPQRPQ